MSGSIKYRYNIMKIDSLDTFMSVRGGCTNSFRDVYFVRALGADASMSETIVRIDKEAEKEVNAKRLEYIRLNKLPKLIKEDDIKYYSEEYDRWKETKKPIKLKTATQNEQLENCIMDALIKVDEIYRCGKMAVSDSIMRNFLIKILFWLDYISKDILCNWSDRRSIKVIAENVIKEQEYLFFFFLTRIGCDVLLIETSMDVKIPDGQKQLSSVFKVGDYKTIALPEYKKYIMTDKNKEKIEENPEKNIKAVSSGNARKSHDKPKEQKNVMIDAKKLVRPAVNRQPDGICDKETHKKEMSYEELAKLASSVVMVYVHGHDGKVTGSGSGIMIGKDGYILTNFHVVKGGSFYSVRIEDDDEAYMTDEVVKYNPNLDMAIIRINKKINPLHIYDGKQKLVRGQKVVAIGSPLGMFNSVSDGIISGFRTINDEDMIQFTAPISAGSSGGAVLNMYGEVIGMSTAGFDNGQNINLAIGYEIIRMFTYGFH